MQGKRAVVLEASDSSSEHRSRASHRQLRIRPSVADDLSFVVHLSERVFRIYGPYGNILGFSFVQQTVFTLIAVEAGKRVGFAMLSSALRGVELAALAIHPTYQGRGVGRALLRDAIRLAERQGAAQMVLHTAEENIGAQRLFFSEGFVLNERVEGYYPNGQAAVELYRVLGDGIDGPKA